MSAYTPYSPASLFNQSTRIGSDGIDLSQQNIQNRQMSQASMTHYFSSPSASDRIDFMAQSGLNGNGKTAGNGLGSSEVNVETNLFWKTNMAREAGKLTLQPRQFITVPYMGKGSVNPDDETNLMRCEYLRDKRTGQPIGSMAALHMPDNYPIDRPFAGIDEDALSLDGWQRGGVSTRADS